MDNMFRKQKKTPTKAMKLKQQLYKTLKEAGKHVDWKHATISQLQESLAEHKGEKKKMNKIYNFVSHAQINRIDARNLNTINSLPLRERIDLSINQFNRVISRIHAPEDRYLFVHIKDEYGSIRKSVALNHKHFDNDNLFLSVEEGVESDSDFVIHDLTLGSVSMEWLPKAKNQTKRSEFFRYFTNEYYNLEEFQVYNHAHDFQSKNKDCDIPCFLYALHQADAQEKCGLEDDLIETISSVMYSSSATHDFIKKTAESFDLYITLKTYRENEDKFDFNTSSYGKKNNKLIELGCVGQHLFAIKPTKVSEYALKYTQFANHQEFPSIRVKNGRVVKNGIPKLLLSHQVIGYLYFHRKTMLTPITLQNAPNLLNNKYDKISSLNSLAMNKRWFKKIGLTTTEIFDGEYITEGQKYGSLPFSTRDPNTKKIIADHFFTVYFDLETFAEMIDRLATRFPEIAKLHYDGDHVPYLAAWKINDGETQYAFGLDCIKTMLDSFPPNCNYLMWAHNAGFDVRFLIKHLTTFDSRCGIIESGNSMKQLVATYEGRKLVMKDTKSFIAGALSGMPEMFPGACDELTLEKESFPHDLMNVDSFDSMMCLDLIKSEFDDAENLIKNATTIGAIENNTLNVKKYAIHYCKRDVDVLAACFERFRDMFLTRFNQDVYNHISMPGLAYSILHNDGCYDDCYSMSGPCLSFARDAIVGGRVMTRDNVKHHTTHEIVDFDAVSLYPSAMARLRGFVKGAPKLHKQMIPKCDYYISKVKITGLTKNLHFPLQSVKADATSSRDFTNDIIGKTIIMDQYALEDLVEFQGATYEVIEGLYWNEGFNNKIVGSITKLFNERLRLKKEGNPLQNGIKLLMNASYGKLIQKPIVKSKVIIKGEQAIDDYTVKRINRLIQRVPISKDIAMFEEHKPLNKHFSPAHLGVQILSMSKRIMNEVMCMAEGGGWDPLKNDYVGSENDLKIWYQDTDSMHIDRYSLPSLVESYKAKYGRELVGKGLGQFHSDFELDGAEGEVYATESYFIGKKTYIDFLACSGNDIQGIHKRMKGIPSKLIDTPRQTYDGLFNGEDQSFEMSSACPIAINNKTQRVSKRSSFKRIVSAPKN